MDVIGFPGQGSNTTRTRIDTGDPDWITGYLREFRPEGTAEVLKMLHPSGLMLVGYSLGGDHIAQLTRSVLAPLIRGIVVYESPVLTVRPASLNCPCVVIWNNYTPWSTKRAKMKNDSICSWNTAYPAAVNLTGNYRSHVRLSHRWPFVRQAWDQSLNDKIALHLGIGDSG